MSFPAGISALRITDTCSWLGEEENFPPEVKAYDVGVPYTSRSLLSTIDGR